MFIIIYTYMVIKKRGGPDPQVTPSPQKDFFSCRGIFQVCSYPTQGQGAGVSIVEKTIRQNYKAYIIKVYA